MRDPQHLTITPSNLIKDASDKCKLHELTLEEIRNVLRSNGLKLGSKKEEAIDLAASRLPQEPLSKLIEKVDAYAPTPTTISEYRLRLYGAPSVHDELRRHNQIADDHLTLDEFMNMDESGFGTPRLNKLRLIFYERASDAPDYQEYLEQELPPAQIFAAQMRARLRLYTEALNDAQNAYHIALRHNDVSRSLNVHHLASIARFCLQLQIMISEGKGKSPSFDEDTERDFHQWIALYDRMSNDGSTSFLIEHYEEMFDEFGDCSRDSENALRSKLGVPEIGKGWISEVELLNLIRELYPSRSVEHQASPDWLGMQRLDVFIPSLNLAIEYQGRQHFHPVEFFGGEKAFRQTQERDNQKALLCEQNGVTLIYFRFDEDIDKELVRSRLSRAIEP